MLNPQKEYRAGNIIILCYDIPPQTQQLETKYSINYDALRSVSVGGVIQPPVISYTIDGSLVVFSEDLPVGVGVQIQIENDKLINHENSTKIFIVHGHDDLIKSEVARFLEIIKLKPIVLHEQVNGGATIIEKIERHSDVAFAVVLMTPDDVGGSNKDNLLPRARQNVVAELGYFLGKLGRNRVAALVKGDVEIPSDFNGVVYTPLDDHGAWKTKLAKELLHAGLSVDTKKVVEA